MFTLPPLPYDLDSLAPHISRETLEIHHGRHHQTYVDNLNTLIEGTEFATRSLEEIIRTAPKGPLFNNAAQVWNHTFYFESLTAPGQPSSRDWSVEPLVLDMAKTWAEEVDFQREFTEKALKNFGSGWTWLVYNSELAKTEIINTGNAETPLTDSRFTPLLTCDVWEHAYYVDYRNARAKYLENFYQVVNWEKVVERYTLITHP